MPATQLFGSTNVDQGLQLLFCIQAPHRTEWAEHTGCFCPEVVAFTSWLLGS